MTSRVFAGHQNGKGVLKASRGGFDAVNTPDADFLKFTFNSENSNVATIGGQALSISPSSVSETTRVEPVGASDGTYETFNYWPSVNGFPNPGPFQYETHFLKQMNSFFAENGFLPCVSMRIKTNLGYICAKVNPTNNASFPPLAAGTFTPFGMRNGRRRSVTGNGTTYTNYDDYALFLDRFNYDPKSGQTEFLFWNLNIDGSPPSNNNLAAFPAPRFWFTKDRIAASKRGFDARTSTKAQSIFTDNDPPFFVIGNGAGVNLNANQNVDVVIDGVYDDVWVEVRQRLQSGATYPIFDMNGGGFSSDNILYYEITPLNASNQTKITFKNPTTQSRAIDWLAIGESFDGDPNTTSGPVLIKTDERLIIKKPGKSASTKLKDVVFDSKFVVPAVVASGQVVGFSQWFYDGITQSVASGNQTISFQWLCYDVVIPEGDYTPLVISNIQSKDFPVANEADVWMPTGSYGALFQVQGNVRQIPGYRHVQYRFLESPKRVRFECGVLGVVEGFNGGNFSQLAANSPYFIQKLSWHILAIPN